MSKYKVTHTFVIDDTIRLGVVNINTFINLLQNKTNTYPESRVTYEEIKEKFSAQDIVNFARSEKVLKNSLSSLSYQIEEVFTELGFLYGLKEKEISFLFLLVPISAKYASYVTAQTLADLLNNNNWQPVEEK